MRSLLLEILQGFPALRSLKSATTEPFHVIIVDIGLHIEFQILSRLRNGDPRMVRALATPKISPSINSSPNNMVTV